MKVIFLDVDGVLNEAGSKSRSPHGFIGVDDDKVDVLKQIVDATGAAIVLSSTWKRGWSANSDEIDNDALYLDKKLARHGLRIIDKTIDDTWNRGFGIKAWLDTHAVEAWLVLDDDKFEDFEREGIMPHFVQTSFLHGGLTEKHIPKCTEILSKEE